MLSTRGGVIVLQDEGVSYRRNYDLCGKSTVVILLPGIRWYSYQMIMTLCIIRRGSRLLLGMKKRGFGAGRWNGFGGKVEPEETIEEAMRREVREEAGIKVTSAEEVGIIEFEFQGNPEILEMHVFRGNSFEGEPREGEEMKPEWYNLGAIPYESMWPDDRYWLPLFLAGKKFIGKFLFGKGDAVLEYSLKSVSFLRNVKERK